MNKPDVKKLILLNLPYVFAFYFADKIAAVFRLAPGAAFIDKLTNGFAVFGSAFANPLPSFHPVDLLIGLSAGVLLKLAVYVKGKNRKKFRQGEEYGSARWGKPEDIKPYMDPEFSNNVILTQTEFLTMNSRPKQPKYARNKNILVIGGSGSGKTRFFVKPNLMQMHSSYVVTDPKGTVLVECGKMLEKGGYVIKSLNTINFRKSMHYNPFSYIRSEKDILKLVNTIIVNTKGDGDKSGEDFWVKAEKLYYRASLAANEECRRAIEAAISSNYGDNRLDADAAVKSVLEQFSPERIRYVLANTIQQKDFDGRIPQPLKEWAKSVEVCPENASRFLVDKPNPGLTALFVDAFRQQTEPQKEVTSEKTEERDPEVVAWENDEITSIEVKTVEVKSPIAPLPEEAAKAPKAHRLTAEEKEIKSAVMDTLKGQIAYNNDGMRASYRASNHSFNLLARNGVKIEGNTVTQNGEPLFKIHRRHAARKTQGCYRELLPTLEYIKQEQKQEKPSIRDQLKAAAKTQPEKKSPVKSKTHDMEL